MWSATRTSSVHSYFSLAMIVFDNMGSTGNSAIRRPSFVSSPRSLSAPRAYSSSSARMSVSPGGGSMNSKPMRSLMPSDLRRSTTEPRFVRWISGTVFSSSSFANAHLVYKRKALPGPTRPARPARWFAEAREHCAMDQVMFHDEARDARLTGTTVSEAMPVRGLNEFCLTKPGSMTNTTPSMVIDVSAMFVASTTLRAPSGVGSKILAWRSAGKFA
jgi:hypothetical protein